MNRFLSRGASLLIFQNIRKLAIPYEYDFEKNRILLTDNQNKQLVIFRLPITFSSPETNWNPQKHSSNYIILLIQAGSCALGYFENGFNLDHKVFKAYMVRMKQGVSQIKYLKTKGKSRAGSRVRLGETVEFFENINERLQTYFSEHTIDRIAISCSKTLIPYFFNSKISTPFNKKDTRIYNIPKHIHTPNYEVLLETHKFLLKGELIYELENQNLIDQILSEPIEKNQFD